MKGVQDIICKAISEKRVISFRYRTGPKTVEPHTLGYDAKGTLVLCGWSRTSAPPGFRDFHVAKLSGLTTTAETFEKARPGYNRNDSTLSRILCRL